MGAMGQHRHKQYHLLPHKAQSRKPGFIIEPHGPLGGIHFLLHTKKKIFCTTKLKVFGKTY